MAAMINPPVEGTACNLECLRKKPITTFEGPVKIVLVDIPRREYCQKIWCAGCIGLAYILMGFNYMFLVCYTFIYIIHEDYNYSIHSHVLYCTTGFQMLMPAGILMNSNLSGPSIPLKPCLRKCSHMLLQLVAICVNLLGSHKLYFRCSWEKFWHHRHTQYGLLALGFSGAAILFSPFALLCRKLCRGIHAIFGIIAFMFSSACFIEGMRDRFSYVRFFIKYDQIANIIIGMCLAYTIIIVSNVVTKLRYCANNCGQQ